MPQSKTSESVACPYCRARFEVEPTSTAGAFKCPKCGQPLTLGALRNPDFRPEAMAIAEAASTASMHNLYPHTAAYVFINQAGEQKIGSGTLVEVSGRCFLATVAHTVPRNVADIWLVKKVQFVSPERLTCVTRREASDNIDVAVFEIESRAVERTGMKPISLDRIHDGRTGNPDFKAKLLGFPDKWTCPNKPSPGVLGFVALTYGCEPVEPSRWPAISTIPGTFDEGRDIVFEFNSDVIEYESDLPVPAGLPDPFGMSGGGLWQRSSAVKDTDIWTADDLCLFGIQSSWLIEKGFLKAVQIIHWLKLLADKYPDVHDELCDRFPRLQQI